MRRNRRSTPAMLASAAVFLFAVCAVAAFAEPQLSPPHFSEWSFPTAVAGQQPPDGCPIESRDGNSLYTASPRAGTLDVWVYERRGRHGPFSGPTRVEEPVSLDEANDFCPTPLQGKWLMFVSDRSDGCGETDIYISKKNPNTGWSEPRNLGCAPDGPNTSGVELSPSLVTTSEGMYLYFSTDVDGDQDIYRSLMGPDGAFAPGVAVAELNTAEVDQQPNVRRDGLEIVFASNRSGGGTQDIWTASRDSVNEPWSDLRNLSVELEFPTVGVSETRPSLSWDRKRLYYGAAGIVYVSEREEGAGSDGPPE